MTTYCVGHHRHDQRCNHGGPMAVTKRNRRIPRAVLDLLAKRMAEQVYTRFEDQAPPFIGDIWKRAKAHD